MNSFSNPSLDDRLHALHGEYVDAVNRAVAEGRDDVVADLVAQFSDEALTLMSAELSAAA